MKFLKTNFGRWLTGFALLIFPIFFVDNFNGGWISIGVYILLVTFGVSMVLYFSSRLLGINPIYFFLISIIIEVGIFSSFSLVKEKQVTSLSMVQFVQNIYFKYLRSIPSFQMGLGKYDSELFYTLLPGENFNRNIEYSNAYKINSQGTRDDEASIDFPEIISLGDSHTMGWGVEQEETFSNLLEKKTKKKVLNTGIVSYGSARQYLMFQKLKTDSCKTILWQYCSNDLRENKSFVKNGNQLKISSEEEYQFRYKRNFLQANYYPFKFCFETMADKMRCAKKWEDSELCSTKTSEQLDYFFKIVALLQEGFDGEIILFNLESFETTDKYFLAFKKHVAKNQLDKIKLIDFSKILNQDDYFIIDGHINVSGHQKVSDTIFEKIKSES